MPDIVLKISYENGVFVFVARTIKRDGQYFVVLGCEGEAYFDSGDKRAWPLCALASNIEFSCSFKMRFIVLHSSLHTWLHNETYFLL